MPAMVRESLSIKSAVRHFSERDMDDPLSLAIAPPEGETQAEAEVRIHQERDALKVSEDIDRSIRLEMHAARRSRCVKMLLLGQSESGKSTVLKNFQRKYDPLAFDRERAAWRCVCQLNVVRSFGIIVDVLNNVLEEQDRLQRSDPLTPPMSPAPFSAGGTPITGTPTTATATATASGASTPKRLKLTAEHRRLIMRLAPLRQIDYALSSRFKSAPLSPPRSPVPSSWSSQELRVCGYAWQRTRQHHHMDHLPDDASERETSYVEDEGLLRVLCACREDMVALWNDPVVRKFLKLYRVGMEELSYFFLDNLARIVIPHYEPTDEDILRARLKTLGVTEHRFTVRQTGRADPESVSAAEVRIYDVGGSRSQRQTWIPFFDDVNAILFLAPMSAFDQTLMESPDINRLEDSFLLWKLICSTKLLVNVSLVLLLNKRDVLEQKLTSGVRFGRYVKSYSGQNEWEPVARYLKSKFKAVQRELSPVPRLFYSHITCATDSKQMAIILGAIEDLVLRRNLQDINLL